MRAGAESRIHQAGCRFAHSSARDFVSRALLPYLSGCLLSLLASFPSCPHPYLVANPRPPSHAPLCVISKPRGIQAARQLRNQRRVQRWNSKKYNKAHSGSVYKSNPFGGASHAKGIVVEKVGIESKQPNSAIRKAVRVQLIKNGKKVTAFVPDDGCLNFIDENDEVLVAGFGRSGHAVGDIPGCRFKVVKVAGVGLYALFRGKKDKPRS